LDDHREPTPDRASSGGSLARRLFHARIGAVNLSTKAVVLGTGATEAIRGGLTSMS
jgi:hypothetical protein